MPLIIFQCYEGIFHTIRLKTRLMIIINQIRFFSLLLYYSKAGWTDTLKWFDTNPQFHNFISGICFVSLVIILRLWAGNFVASRTLRAKVAYFWYYNRIRYIVPSSEFNKKSVKSCKICNNHEIFRWFVGRTLQVQLSWTISHAKLGLINHITVVMAAFIEW